MQKYNVRIADMELNLISDASPEEVKAVTEDLNRSMRAILDKSSGCSTGEAAVLCALSDCSEKLTLTEKLKNLEKATAGQAEEIERLKKSVESLQEENNRLRKDTGGKIQKEKEKDFEQLTAFPDADSEKPKEKGSVGGMFAYLTYRDV